MIKHRSKCFQSISLNSFLKAVNILLAKPHVINKRLWGNKILIRFLCTYNQKVDIQKDCKRLDNISTESIKQFAVNVLQILGFVEIKESNDKIKDKITEVLFIELLPKSYSSDRAYQLILIYKNEAKVTFYDVTPENLQQQLCPNFSYTLMIENEDIVLNACCDENSKSYQWLIKSLVQQFIKWAKDFENNAVIENICTESLALVSKNKYYHKYNELKIKYGKEMVKIWPECTDPLKFVYEDVAIATYLLLIWEEDKGNKKQTFVDLGCGNGLLVYILTKEGHTGLGIDVRKRQIWSIYSSDIQLEERTIVPSEVSLFPDADWIIGNHSDELTPWIPVLAARSSYKCNFFVLPCCAYNFDGTKYQRKNSNKSQYVEYLEYIKSLCEECGFTVKIDRLKIPSTKRICLIGKGREYDIKESNNYFSKIQAFIERDTNSQEDGIQNSMWIKDFKVRESYEKVRNCTQIDKKIIETIVTRICSYLLEGCIEGTHWSLGKSAVIQELIQIIPQEELKKLKSECGGLQTLLKNNHHIFQVQSGIVQLRYPTTIDEVTHKTRKNNKSVNFKLQHKPCWFYSNHPQGCPLSDKSCSFLHDKR